MELGGEFNLDLNTLSETAHSVDDYLSEEHPWYFDSGRSALRFAAQGLRPGTVLLPEYICDSVIAAFSGHPIRFYRLTPSLEIDMSDLLTKLDGSVCAVFLMHYFGAVQSAAVLGELKAARQQYEFCILEDTTHSLFSMRRTIGNLCVCSLRKWFALPGGGVLYGSGIANREGLFRIQRKSDNSRAYGMVCKSLFLSNKLDCNQEYLSIFRETEETLDVQEDVFKMSDFSRFLLHTVDADVLAARRRQNYDRLKSALAQMDIYPICQINAEDCPLVLPIWAEKRDELRHRFMERKIYCAVHWPFDGRQAAERPLARDLAAHMISLPIDQRYDSAHMEYLLNALDQYKGLIL